MTQQGFLTQRRRHPVALTAAVSINLLAVTALMLAKSEGVPRLPESIRLIDPTLDPPPPPPNPQAKPPQTRSRARTVYTPKTIVDPIEPVTGEKIEGSAIWTDPGSDTKDDPGPTADPTPPLKAIPVTVDPVLTSAARDLQPPYPTQLLRLGVEGRAVVRVLVGADGRVKQVAILSADDPLFAEATERQALRRWRFKPATRDGVPVEAWKQLTVVFEIN